ncbi:MAG: response regulator transcription factor [Woeseia sp.]
MPRVLIIDDEEDIRDVLYDVLIHAGFDVNVASTGDEGIDELRSKPADVIVTDIIMPEKDGVTTIREIRKEFPDAKIIAISGGGNFGPDAYEPNAIKTSAYLAAADEAGADVILPKPFERKVLMEAIRALTAG